MRSHFIYLDFANCEAGDWFSHWACAKMEAVDVRSRPGDVLSQPTRARLFALLAELRRPAPTDELAERLELHPNGVRLHLEQLHTAGLVTRERERRERGRPRDRWTIAPGAMPGGERPTAYAELSRWLVQAMATGRSRAADVEESARAIGRNIAPDPGGEPAEPLLHDALSAMGFQPRRHAAGDSELTYCLGNCPYRAAVREQPKIVCALHRGMTIGLLERLAPDTEVTDFVAGDPDEGGCLITVKGPLAAQATSPGPIG